MSSEKQIKILPSIMKFLFSIIVVNFFDLLEINNGILDKDLRVGNRRSSCQTFDSQGFSDAYPMLMLKNL